jgi:hypothetical protein
LLSIHHYPSAFERPLLISNRYSLMTIFGRIRPTPICEQYTFSADYFLRTRMLRKTPTDRTNSQMPNSGGPK